MLRRRKHVFSIVVSHVLYPPAEGREVTGAVDLEADPVHQPQGEALLLGTTATVHRSFCDSRRL